ncbi:hypothetical protein EHQ53_04895 [Leptospira langatensis]|uniref:Lipoprotein n=1 Tax=Leptospira langatensis TaxID=2484983 RepID=A0A5F1ZW00_9LEPT|nr:hypothetical protein [Leptospira langatensis]TGK00153.1 hypothetical protein EHO57_12755 [Leptospira langatensis]TGL42788.1 hypothetical protein EHQ53_04895 [Leptospira langatensis]
MRTLKYIIKRFLISTSLVILSSCIFDCGLVLTGTDVGRELLGLSNNQKDDSSEKIASLLGLVSGSSLLEFNPTTLTMAVFAYQSYTASIKTPIPSTWTNDGESFLDLTLTPSGCPSASDDNYTSISFSGSSSYSAQNATFRFLGTGNCVIIHSVSGATPDIGLPTGAVIGILPVVITP